MLFMAVKYLYPMNCIFPFPPCDVLSERQQTLLHVDE